MSGLLERSTDFWLSAVGTAAAGALFAVPWRCTTDGGLGSTRTVGFPDTLDLVVGVTESGCTSVLGSPVRYLGEPQVFAVAAGLALASAVVGALVHVVRASLGGGTTG